MRAYRIADERFPIFDGTGAKIAGARWNSPGRPVIYAAETFAGAMLEILVHAAIDRLPKTYVYVELGIPDAVVTESTNLAHTFELETEGQTLSRKIGDRWLQETRSAVLIVPSIVTNGVETNLLVNPLHPDCPLIQLGTPKPVVWDSRFFRERLR